MRLFHRSTTTCFYIVTAVCLVWISGVHVSGSAQCSCYSFDGNFLRLWSDAQKLCKNNRGELVSMETLEEWEFIKTQIQNRETYYKEWWIGLVKTDGGWKWLSNQTLTYNRWEGNKPVSSREKIYARIAKNYPPGTYGLFQAIRRDLKRGTICEYKRPACSGNEERWCSGPTSTTTITTPTEHQATKKTPVIKTTINTPYNNKPSQHASMTYQQKTTPLHVHNESGTITSVPPKLAKAVVVNTDCLPYPLLVTAIFVSVLGGLTVLATVAFFLVPLLLKNRRSSVV